VARRFPLYHLLVIHTHVKVKGVLKGTALFKDSIMTVQLSKLNTYSFRV